MVDRRAIRSGKRVFGAGQHLMRQCACLGLLFPCAPRADPDPPPTDMVDAANGPEDRAGPDAPVVTIDAGFTPDVGDGDGGTVSDGGAVLVGDAEVPEAVDCGALTDADTADAAAVDADATADCLTTDDSWVSGTDDGYSDVAWDDNSVYAVGHNLSRGWSYLFRKARSGGATQSLYDSENLGFPFGPRIDAHHVYLSEGIGSPWFTRVPKDHATPYDGRREVWSTFGHSASFTDSYAYERVPGGLWRSRGPDYADDEILPLDAAAVLLTEGEYFYYKDPSGKVFRLRDAETSPEPLPSALDGAIQLFVNDTHWHWTTAAGEIKRIGRSGGCPEVIGSGVSGQTLHGSQSYLFWHDAEGQLHRLGKADREHKVVAELPRETAEDAEGAYRVLFADDRYVYAKSQHGRPGATGYCSCYYYLRRFSHVGC